MIKSTEERLEDLFYIIDRRLEQIVYLLEEQFQIRSLPSRPQTESSISADSRARRKDDADPLRKIRPRTGGPDSAQATSSSISLSRPMSSSTSLVLQCNQARGSPATRSRNGSLSSCCCD